MVLATYLILLLLAVASAVQGQLRVALVFAAVKAVLVGLEFMELRHAAREHLVAFVAFVGLLLTALELMN